MPSFGALVLATSGLVAQEPDSTRGVELTYAVGADLSFLKSAEDRGVQFKESGVARPGLDIFRDHGYDWIRLRLFHTPTQLPNDLEYTIALAQEAKARGFKFLLDYHYADGWADPGKQPTPAAWDTTDIDVLVDSVHAWTRNTIRAFREAENWDNFARLFKAGIDGIDAGRGQAPRPLIMLHYDNGADTDGAKAFFDRFNDYDIPYDIIGYSYYPWWHGNLLELRDNLLSTLHPVQLPGQGRDPGGGGLPARALRRGCAASVPRRRPRRPPQGVPRGCERDPPGDLRHADQGDLLVGTGQRLRPGLLRRGLQRTARHHRVRQVQAEVGKACRREAPACGWRGPLGLDDLDRDLLPCAAHRRYRLHLMLTRYLLILVAAVAALGLWRLARWYRRPRLLLADVPELAREGHGVRIAIGVRNEGAGTGRRCRAELLRAERWEAGSWSRVDSLPDPMPEGTGGAPATIAARGTATLRVERLLPPQGGRYRVELAVINGDEVRRSYVVEIDADDVRRLD
jgi:hypothetical protein